MLFEILSGIPGFHVGKRPAGDYHSRPSPTHCPGSLLSVSARRTGASAIAPRQSQSHPQSTSNRADCPSPSSLLLANRREDIGAILISVLGIADGGARSFVRCILCLALQLLRRARRSTGSSNSIFVHGATSLKRGTSSANGKRQLIASVAVTSAATRANSSNR
jgi:hypothetical protein